MFAAPHGLVRLHLLFAVFFAISSPVGAVTFAVNTLADENDGTPGDGLCATASGACTLRAALEESNAFAGTDIISVPSGTYALSNGTLNVAGDVSIIGANASTTIVDGAGQYRVFSVFASSRTINLERLTIQNGNVDGSTGGGGFINWGTNTVSFIDVVIQNNRAGDGGGIYNQSGNLTLTRTEVRNNTASDPSATGPAYKLGGGIYHSQGILDVRNSTISGNTATIAGGFFNFGSATIESSTISENTATNDGYALNGGQGGGGIVNGSGSSATLTVNNSTISGNLAFGSFGGMHNWNGPVFLNNVTMTANVADANNDAYGTAGGFAVDPSYSAFVYLRNTIVAGNSSPAEKDCMNFTAGRVVSYGYNLIGNNLHCAMAAATGDQVGTNAAPIVPLLGSLAANNGPTRTHALLSGSPAIDAGNPLGCGDGATLFAFDQRGVTRALDGGFGAARCDIGAYESNRPPIANAGLDQTISSGSTVNLNGSASSDPDGTIASYAWIQIGGTHVTLSSANTATPTFTAPNASATLTFELSVIDNNGASASDAVVITVNVPPVASAGPDQTVSAGANVSLDGSASSDADGTIASYSWIQTGGTTVAIASPGSPTPSFTAPSAAATLTFQLTVTDNSGTTGSDTVVINVNAPSATPSGGNGGGGGGGGCTISRTSGPDPLLPMLVLVASLMLWRSPRRV